MAPSATAKAASPVVADIKRLAAQVAQATTVDQLETVLVGCGGVIPGSREHFTAKEINDRVRQTLAGVLPVKAVTKTAGLRSWVERRLAQATTPATGQPGDDGSAVDITRFDDDPVPPKPKSS